MKLRLQPAPATALLALFLTACPEAEGPEPYFPENYRGSYVEVRDCRGSGDHDLNNIRILADPAALGPYQMRDREFPVDAVVLKEEYDFGDMTCTGPIKRWTVMQRLPTGSSPDTLDWSWQTVDVARRVTDVEEPRCIGCHQGCGVAPDGFDGTCAVP